MKTFNLQGTSLGVDCLCFLLLIGGCKKELANDSTKLKKPDLLLSNDVGIRKTKVLRQSPGLKIEVKGETIERISPTLKSIDKITSILTEEQGQKNQGGAMTTASATFTATLNGTYYNCYAELNYPGPYDWYLINWNTGVYTYIGSSTDYINFTVQKPSMYGNYRVWGEGPYGAGFTGYQYMGDSYSGVSIVSGVMSFTDTTAMVTIEVRLASAMEDHLANFADPLNYMSDDDYNNYAESVGFDEFLPMREFEAHFGHYSLRQKIESEEIAWLNSSSDPWLVSTNPDDLYTIEDEYDRVFRNQYSQIKIAGNLYEPVSATKTIETAMSCSQSSGVCTDKDFNVDWYDLPDGRRIHYKVLMSPSEADNSENANNVLRAFFKGKIKCYQKKGSLFSKRRTQMAVRIQGTAYRWAQYLGNCNVVHHNFDENKPLRRSYHRDREKRYRTNNIHVKTCESYATFTVGSTTFSQPLN